MSHQPPAPWHRAHAHRPSQHTLALHRVAIAAALCLLGMAQPAAAQTGNASANATAQTGTIAFNLPTQPLGQALTTLAQQAGAQVLFSAPLTEGKTAPALQGSYSVEQGLDRLLAGSGLVAHRSGNAWQVQAVRVASAGEVNTLPEVVVTASPIGPDSYATQGTTVGTGRIAMKPREVPRSVSVMTRQQMEDQNITTLERALANMTGVTLQGTSAGGMPNFYSRGYAIQNIQIDGANFGLNTGGEGQTTHSLGDMSMYEQVELLRGPDGMFTGNGNPGGAVTLVRKRPSRERQIAVGLNVGSWDHYRAEADISQPITADGSIRSRFVLTGQDSKHWSNHVFTQSKMAYGIVEADIGRNGVLSFGGDYEDKEYTPLWYSLLDSGTGELVRGWRYGVQTSENLTKNKASNLFAKLEYNIADDWVLNASINRRKTHGGQNISAIRSYNSTNNLVDGNCVAPTKLQPSTGAGCANVYTFDSPTSENRTGMDASLTGKFSLFGRSHDVMLGANLARNRTLFTGANDANAPGSMTIADLWNWTVPERDFSTPSWMYRNRSTHWGYYSNVRFHLADPLKLIVGGRWSRTKTGSHSCFSAEACAAATLTVNHQRNAFVPYYALTYDLTNKWTTYVSYSETYTPTTDGVWTGTPGNMYKDYTPTTGENWEIGLKGDLMGGRLQASGAVFYLPKENVWATDYSSEVVIRPDGTEGRLQYLAPKQTSKGVDLELKGEVQPGWQLSAGYTYNKTWNSGTKKPFQTFLPENILRTWTTYKIGGTPWMVGGGVNWQSDTDLQGSYALINAMVGYQATKNVRATLSIDNVGNKVHVTNASWGKDHRVYGDPRRFTLAVRAQF